MGAYVGTCNYIIAAVLDIPVCHYIYDEQIGQAVCVVLGK